MAAGVRNMLIAFLLPLPSLLFFFTFVRPSNQDSRSTVSSWCAAHPLLVANLVFLFNVDLLFWLIGNLLSNHWLIDLYWTVIPVMLLHYYRAHPAAVADAARAA
uniref:Uncharacterized protein n=1 Tax=Oryza brachyantha TaxID=4533 RepID=J3LV60_ORYBR